MINGVLLDEHLPLWWRSAISRKITEPEIWRLGDPATIPLGSDDDVILDWCEKNGFFLLTNNRATIPVHLAQRLAQGKHVPSIVDPALKMTVLVEELELILGATFENEYRDQIRHLPVT